MADKTRLMQLVYYAIDKASPDNLAITPGKNSLQAISDCTLTSLKITSQGVADMWQIINVFAGGYAGGKAVPQADQTKCKTVGDVWKAVCKAPNVDPSL